MLWGKCAAARSRAVDMLASLPEATLLSLYTQILSARLVMDAMTRLCNYAFMRVRTKVEQVSGKLPGGRWDNCGGPEISLPDEDLLMGLVANLPQHKMLKQFRFSMEVSACLSPSLSYSLCSSSICSREILASRSSSSSES